MDKVTPKSSDVFQANRNRRDGGDYSFDFYMETRHASLALGTHKIQKLGV